MKELRILAIGNSFSVDSMEYLWNIATNYGFNNIILGNLYIGGCSLETHWNNAKDNLKNYLYYKNTTGTWDEIQNTSILDALRDESWDYISLQQASGKSGLLETYNEDLINLIDYIRKYHKNPNTKLMWNMTWSYQNNSTHNEFNNYNHDQQTMYQSIVNTVQKTILNNGAFCFVIPTGTAIQNMRTSSIGDTLTRDGYHLSLNLGRFVAGMTWFKAITGLLIDEITFKPEGVSEHDLQIVKEAVNHASSRPFSITKSKL